MDDSGEIVLLRFRPEPEDVTIRIPTKALVVIREIAEERDMSVEALLRYYISFGLREDVSRRWAERHRAENIEEGVGSH
jgi:hypothetical protein